MNEPDEGLEEVAVTPIPINAYFEKRLKPILLELYDILMVVEPALKDAKIRVAELADYLRFEIDKAKLSVTKDLTVDASIEQTRLDELRQARLEYILDEFEPAGVVSSVVFIRELTKELKVSFYGAKEENKDEKIDT